MSGWPRRIVPLFLGVVVCACGGGGGTTTPTAPSTPRPGIPAGTVLTFQSAEDASAAAGTTVVVAGRSLAADGGGQVVLDTPVSLGATLDAVAMGFLDRQTLLRSPSETQFTLWPRTSLSGLTEDLTQKLIYTSTGEDAVAGDQVLERLPTGTAVTLVPSAEILADARAHALVLGGATLIEEVTRGAITVTVAETPEGSSFPVSMRVDPDDRRFAEDETPPLAFARIWTNARSEIYRAEVLFRELRYARTSNVAWHELGHVLGFGHSPGRSDLMHCCSASPRTFSERERLLVRLAYQRKPGNRFPDDDRTSRSLSAGRMRVVVCGAE